MQWSWSEQTNSHLVQLVCRLFLKTCVINYESVKDESTKANFSRTLKVFCYHSESVWSAETRNASLVILPSFSWRTAPLLFSRQRFRSVMVADAAATHQSAILPWLSGERQYKWLRSCTYRLDTLYTSPCHTSQHFSQSSQFVSSLMTAFILPILNSVVSNYR